ncbi:MAG: UDP-N-acetylmuramate dehydrogenase [Patescibacteria group bacterium]|nr:UDP-N-acetylmuramate dehydrogenase [Patescibacteria group bacterium]
MGQEFESDLSGVQLNVSLKNHSTFRVGGKTKYFFVVRKKQDLIKAVKLARKYNLLFFILGGGSKLLISDKEYQGLVIKIQMSEFKIQNNEILTEAGLSTATLVNIALENNLTGLEPLTGIPGTVGGATRGNAGASGGSIRGSIGDVIKQVEVFDREKEEVKIFKNKDCKFNYRTSIFKENPNLIVLSCVIQLKEEDKIEIEKKMKAYLAYRKKTQPLSFPSIGSIFKNYALTKSKISNFDKKLLKEFPELEKFIEKRTISAGYLIDKCDLKGKIIGEAKVSEKHANFIVNLGNAKAKDVKKLIELIKTKVKNKFGIILEEEIQYFNF